MSDIGNQYYQDIITIASRTWVMDRLMDGLNFVFHQPMRTQVGFIMYGILGNIGYMNPSKIHSVWYLRKYYRLRETKQESFIMFGIIGGIGYVNQSKINNVS